MDPPNPPVQVPNSDQLFHIAFAERKKMNLELLKQYTTARTLSLR